MVDAFLSGCGTAVPPFYHDTETFIERDAAMRRELGQDERVIGLMGRIARKTGVKGRYQSHSLFAEHPDPDDEFVKKGGQVGARARSALWYRLAPQLAEEAARKAVRMWGKDVKGITHVVTVSTSGWHEPGIASHVVHALGLDVNIVAKMELNYNGCFAGMSALRAARDIIRGDESGAVLVVAVELASTQYSPVSTDVETLTSLVLFGDGASCLVLDKDPAANLGWKFTNAGAAMVPDSNSLLQMNMGLNEDRDHYYMHLARDVAARLQRYFTDENGVQLMDKLMRLHGERTGNDKAVLPRLVIHPGGPKILDELLEPMMQRGFDKTCLDRSYAVLFEVGNLGAAAMPFVLCRTLEKEAAGEPATENTMISMAFGPGVTVEWGFFTRCEEAA